MTSKENFETRELPKQEHVIEQQGSSTKESILAKGEERYAKLSNSISGAKDKVKSWVSGGTAKLGRLFKGAMVRGLAAPDAAKHIDNKMGEMAVEAGKGIGYGMAYAGEKVGQGLVAGYDSMDKAYDWAENQATSALNFTGEQFKKANDFAKNKGEQVKSFASEKAAMIESNATLIKNKTVEGLQSAKEGVSKRWGSLIEYGRNAIIAAEMRKQQARDKKNAALNKARELAVQSQIMQEHMNAENLSERLQASLKRLAQLQEFQKNSGMDSMAA